MAAVPNGRRGQWRRVSVKDPCPICQKPKWCAVSADGNIAKCQHIEQGAFKTGRNNQGEPYYLHRMKDGSRPAADSFCPSNGSAIPRADSDTLNAVYDALLGTLALSAAHREQLRKRGLLDSEIDRRLYRSFPVQGRAPRARNLGKRFGTDKLLSVPGFVAKEGNGQKYLTIAGSAGLLIPVRDLNGRIAALKVRRDDDGYGSRYSYLSSSKHGGPSADNAVHVPLGIPGAAATVRLTEGELKADVAYLLTGTPTISVPGVAAWLGSVPVLRQLDTKTVLVAFDADAADKSHVARALSDAFEGLSSEGFSVEIERWPSEHGKGIDDLLAAGQAPEVLAGDAARDFVAETLAAATAGEPLPPPNPLDRLGGVLAEGGAASLFGDKPLLEALASLAENDAAEFACRRASIKTCGVSLRDLDRALAPLRQAIRSAKPPLTSAGEYKVSGGRIVHLRPTKDGPVEAPLCNFTARITEQTTVDDGAEKSIKLTIEGQLVDGTPLPSCAVAADKFSWMDWIVPAWGTRAVVNAGALTKDHLRCAIQSLSRDARPRMVYGHLGWRKIGERWVYLHAGGAIGVGGPVDGIEVAAPGALERYLLPLPPNGDDLRRAVHASLSLLNFGPPGLAFPLLASAYRAALGPCDFAVHLMGQSGVYKSEYAALVQQHFGAEMDRPNLPASWTSTANALESTAFAAKDALLVVDDFAPSGSANDVARLHREAERLLRAQGNGAGRQRMRRDGSLAPAKPPRGLILSTGEDVPRGQSLRARTLILEVGRGDFGPPSPASNPGLSALQSDAANGLFAASLAGFVSWLAPRYETIRAGLSAERAQLRDSAAGDGQHARTPNLIADLAIGLRYLLNFAAHVGAIDARRYGELWDLGWSALREAGAAQAEHVRSADAVDQFLRLLTAALASGRAHVAATDGGQPETPAAWGWRQEHFRDGPEWRPQGRRVGWIDGEQLYLEPDASYATAQSMAGEMGESVAVAARTMWTRMRERGLLAGWDTRGEKRSTVRRRIAGKQHAVLFLRADTLSLPETGHSGHSGHSSENHGKNDTVSMAGSLVDGRLFRPLAGETAIETAQNPAELEANGRNGRNGRFPEQGSGTAQEKNSASNPTGEPPVAAGWTAPDSDAAALDNPFLKCDLTAPSRQKPEPERDLFADEPAQHRKEDRP